VHGFAEKGLHVYWGRRSPQVWGKGKSFENQKNHHFKKLIPNGETFEAGKNRFKLNSMSGKEFS